MEATYELSLDGFPCGDDPIELSKPPLQAVEAVSFVAPDGATQTMVEAVDPRLGEVVLDPACGTGGFLVEAFNHLGKQVKTVEDRKRLQEASIFGGEAKPLPFLLCQMNLLLHGLEAPRIDPENSLRFPLNEIGDRDRVDVILTNPPFGGEEERGILSNFAEDKQTTETALLFLQLIMNADIINRTIDAMCIEITAQGNLSMDWRLLTEDQIFYEAAICIFCSQMQFEMAVAAADRLLDLGLLRSRQLADMDKTVLFVAEKTAALEVVYRRLKTIGLGEFCLELHSHKANKLEVLKQLRQSWEARADADQATWDEESARMEGPIRADVLARRIAKRCGLHKAGSRIREKVLQVAEREFKGIKEDGALFIWPADTIPGQWDRFRATVNDESRPADEICLAELVALARDVVSQVAPGEDPVMVMTGKSQELIDALKRLSLHSMQQYRTRYLLARLTQHVDMAFSGLYTPGSLEPFIKLEIEHILPDNPTTELRNKWANENPNADYDDYKNRLGNLTLLEKPINIVAGNDFYEVKQAEYRKSGNYLTRSLVDLTIVGQNTSISRINAKLVTFPSWDATSIEKRHGRLLARRR